jgi:hypothetical protein
LLESDKKVVGPVPMQAPRLTNREQNEFALHNYYRVVYGVSSKAITECHP